MKTEEVPKEKHTETRFLSGTSREIFLGVWFYKRQTNLLM